MNSLSEFLTKLFDVSDWPARWHCGKWSDFHGWMYIASDLFTWLAYFIIPITIFWFIQKQPKVPFIPIFGYFAAFIVFCGLTHLIDAVIFWWPAYRLSAFLRLCTASISMITVFIIIRDLPKILNLNVKSNEESLKTRIKSLEKDLLISNNKIADMRDEIKRLSNESHN